MYGGALYEENKKCIPHKVRTSLTRAAEYFITSKPFRRTPIQAQALAAGEQ